MTQYRYSPLGSDNELSETQMKQLNLADAFGEICIVSVDDLSEPSLRQVVDLVTEQPNILMDDGCPLVIEVKGGQFLSDRAFWTLVCDSAPDALELVSQFVRAVIVESQSGYKIPFDRGQGIVSEDAMYAYFDTRLWALAQFQVETPGLLDFGELFLEWLKASDLDHEVRQQPYVERLLHLLRYKKDQNLLSERIIHYKMNVGQHPPEDAIERMKRDGFLRLVVDEELALLRGETGPLGSGLHRGSGTSAERSFASSVIDLIDYTYGNSPARNDVIDYVLGISGLNLETWQKENQPPHVLKGAAGRRQWGDDQPLALRFDTGFHTVEDGGWFLDPQLATPPN